MPLTMSSNASDPVGQHSESQSYPDMSKVLYLSQNPVLSKDVVLRIFDLLPKSSLRTVAQVSKAFHDLALPVLYHTVNFSAKPVIDIHGVGPRFWRPQRSINDIQIRQWRFAQQIVRKPSYGALVRSFVWTIGFENRMHHRTKTYSTSARSFPLRYAH